MSQTSGIKWLTPTRVGIILVLVGLATAIYGIGIVLVILGVLLIAIDQRRLKCPNCQRRGQLVSGRSTLMNEERGFGLVTRADTIRTQKGGQVERTTVNRQERVPVVRRTVRTYYTCRACNKESWIDRTTQTEDFSPPQQTPTVIEKQKETIVTKEVLIQCRSCGSRYPQGTPKCLTCGANL